MITPVNLLRNPDSYTTSLLALCLSKYGTECLEWDPLTIRIQLTEDFGAEPHPVCLNKIQAGSSVVLTNLFQVSPEMFVTVCNTFSRGLTVTDVMIPANVSDMAWGIAEARMLSSRDDWDQGFSHNVRMYMGVLLDQEGFYELPSVFRMAEFINGNPEDAFKALNGDDTSLYDVYYSRQNDLREAVNDLIRQRTVDLLTELSLLDVPGIDRKVVLDMQSKIKQSSRPTGEATLKPVQA